MNGAEPSAHAVPLARSARISWHSGCIAGRGARSGAGNFPSATHHEALRRRAIVLGGSVGRLARGSGSSLAVRGRRHADLEALVLAEPDWRGGDGDLVRPRGDRAWCRVPRWDPNSRRSCCRPSRTRSSARRRCLRAAIREQVGSTVKRLHRQGATENIGAGRASRWRLASV
jgi:hypothetical protein